jgi:hypothetical protein
LSQLDAVTVPADLGFVELERQSVDVLEARPQHIIALVEYEVST